MEPSDEELLGLMPQQLRDDLATVAGMAAHGAGPDVTPELFEGSLTAGALQFARAVLAHRGHQPALPVEGEVGELVEFLLWHASGLGHSGHGKRGRLLLTRAADLLEQRHPEPVPVSEKLPEPGDCDAEGRCWWGLEESDDYEACWTLRKMIGIPFDDTHWLPAHALPLPAGEVQQ